MLKVLLHHAARAALVSLALALALALAPPAPAQQPPAAPFRQSEAVKARYPDLPVALATPAFAPGKADFTSHAEMSAFLAALAARAPTLKLMTLGESRQGRAIPAALVTAEGLADPAAIRALGRPVVWMIGLQHGNEPAGGEGALAVLQALAEGEMKPLLARVSVVVVPRANPDGAETFRRTTANGADMNRDHLTLGLPETRALRRLLAVLPPDLLIDAHEMMAVGRWMAKFGALQGPDMTVLYATHPMVDPALSGLAQERYFRGLERRAAAAGVSMFWYYTSGPRVEDKSVQMGGNYAGIGRNLFGLAGAVSFLIETRGIDIGRESYQRRVATHYLAAKALLELTADDPALVLRTVRAARDAVGAGRGDIVVTYRNAREPWTIPLIDPETGAPRPTAVDFENSLKVTPLLVRPRPYAYVLAPSQVEAARRLAANGVAVRRVTAPGRGEGAAYRVRAVEGGSGSTINPDQRAAADLVPGAIDVPAGAFLIVAAQPAANLVFAALEPEAPGSFFGADVLPRAGEPVLFRLAVPAALATEPFEP
jgi:hypothetical protein